jgi:hypothetical protein
MLFRLKTIDEADIQVQLLEGGKQKQQTNPHKGGHFCLRFVGN